MTTTNIEVPNGLLDTLRQKLAVRQATYGQARLIAQMQASQLRHILSAHETRFPLNWIENIPGVSVTMVSAAQMEQLTGRPNASGLTKIGRDGSQFRIYINENNSITHCRFTLCHELYHVIAGPLEQEAYGDFGFGDSEVHSARVERIAEHFAANLLIPKPLLTQAWALPLRDITALAELFGVSEDAMRIRLQTTGIVRKGVTKRMFYRAPRLTPEPDMPLNYPEISCPGRVLTVEEAAERLRISKWMLYKLIQRRKIATFKIGSRRLIAESAVWQLVKQLSGEEAA